MTIDAWGQTHIGRVRKSNQDFLGCFPDLGLFLVADGMGGHTDGEIASRTAVEVIRNVVHERQTDVLRDRERKPLFGVISRLLWNDNRYRRSAAERASSELVEAVDLANQRIFAIGRMSAASGETRPPGTTIVALRIAQGRAHWAHVGDSRLYRVRDGTLQLLTADHTDYGEPYRGSINVPLDLRHTNVLSQAIGIRHAVDIGNASDVALPGDVYLLCSDGVYSLVPAAVIRELLHSGRPLAEIGEELIRRSLEAGGTDNATVVLVEARDS